MGFFSRRKPTLFDVATGVVDGNKITYSFTKPVPQDRAMQEFKEAVEKGIPSGSVIMIP